METNLRAIQSFREKLIESSMRKAFDEYLRFRFIVHLRRLLQMLHDRLVVEDTFLYAVSISSTLDKSVSELMHSKFWDRGVKDYSQGYSGSEPRQHQIARAEAELERLLSLQSLSKIDVILVNELAEGITDYFNQINQRTRSIALIERLLSLPSQTKDDTTKWLTRLAQAHIGDENICDATAVLYLAFNIPEPHDYDPEAEPFVLPQTK
jgi:hypothetical protein